MFAVGEVVWALSDQVEAAGKPYVKPKYHLCVCVTERIYFFINSSDKFADSFAITHEEFRALPNPVSFVGCGSTLRIPDAHMVRMKARSLGRLPDETLTRLMDFVNSAESIVEEEKELIVDALAGALGY